MTPDVGRALQRIAAATSVIRTRTQDDQRSALHADDVADRVRVLVAKLEKIADQLEEAIA